jgi:acyl-CoA dehydrogenase
MVQEKIADSWMGDRAVSPADAAHRVAHRPVQGPPQGSQDIAAVKALMPKGFHDVAARALHLYIPLGATQKMPFVEQVIQSSHMGLADGPTKVHKITVACQVLREYQATLDVFLTEHLPNLREAAVRKYAEQIEREMRAQS